MCHLSQDGTILDIKKPNQKGWAKYSDSLERVSNT